MTNDNDGVDDNSGETQLLNLGKIVNLTITGPNHSVRASGLFLHCLYLGLN
jgi:hypothetical protein